MASKVPDFELINAARCSRSCYNCPSCTAPLAVTQLGVRKDDGLLKPSDATTGNETYILQCQYCDWSTLDINVQFSKPTKITEQSIKLRKARTSTSQSKDTPETQTLSHEESFGNLSTFYKEQLSDAGDTQSGYPSSPYSSPANLARIMSLYGGLSHQALKKSREKPQPMREALSHSEGFSSYEPTGTDIDAIQSLQHFGWEGTATFDQRHPTPFNNEVSSTHQLWPAATQLRTRRGRRCKTCRQFLTRPEQKVGSMRYRIRLLALNHIPRLSTRPLHPAGPITNPAFHLRSDTPEQDKLQPHQTKQYVLTIRNPIFEPVRITLATPLITPGKVASRVTILCPSFSVGPAGDIWDEALSMFTTSTSADGGRTAAMASLTGSAESTADRQPEAGKIWDKTRNSTSVVIEIVPGSLQRPPNIVPDSSEERDDWEEDDDVLEVPVYVRAEWEAAVRSGTKRAIRRPL